MTAALALVLLASAAAAATDLRTRRIPNLLVLALFVFGLIVNAFAGWQHLLMDAGLTAGVLIAGTLAFSLKLIGGGDVKLLAAAAGTLGIPMAGAFLLYTLLSGGIIAVLYSAFRGRLGATFANVRALALPVFAGVRPARLENGTAMPYALAIFAGACIAALAGGAQPHLRFPW